MTTLGQASIVRFAMRTVSAVLLGVVVLSASPTEAQSLRDETSLGLVPADAGFYVSSLNNRQKVDGVLDSNALAALLESPIVQEGLRELARESGIDLLDPAAFLELIADPQARQAALVGIDMLSHEVFIYGDEGWGRWFELLNEWNLQNSLMPLEAELAGRWIGPDEAAARAALRVLAENRDALRTPTMVVGFRVTDADAAAAQLDLLEAILRDGLAELARELPDVELALARLEINDAEFLSVTVDGSMFPWDELGLERFEEERGQYEETIEALEEMRCVVSVGVLGDYVLLSIGESNEHLAEWGEGDLLLDRAELAHLREDPPERLSTIYYMSHDTVDRLNSIDSAIETWVNLLEMGLSMADESPAFQRQVRRDAEQLRAELTEMIPATGAEMGYSFLTDRGIEGYTYSWAETGFLDATQPLSILEHVGEDPLLVVAARSGTSYDWLDTLTHWFETGVDYFETLVVEREMTEREQDQYEDFRDDAEPLLKEGLAALETEVLPALDDGQWALVIDANLMADEWFWGQPESDEQLPMIELAWVLGVSDSELLRDGCRDLFEVADELTAALWESTDGEFPFRGLPRPDRDEVRGGDIYTFDWYELDFHRKISPNAGLGEDVAVLSLNLDHTERILAGSRVERPRLWQEHRDDDLCVASYWDIAGTVDAIAPWVRLAIVDSNTVYHFEDDFRFEEGPIDPDAVDPFGGEDPFSEGPAGGDDPFGDVDPFGEEDPFEAEGHGDHHHEHGRDDFTLEEQLELAEAIMNMIRCCRDVSTVAYKEDGVLVTHYEMVIEDIEERR